LGGGVTVEESKDPTNHYMIVKIHGHAVSEIDVTTVATARNLFSDWLNKTRAKKRKIA
jgi:hypothetical protein